MSSHDTPSTDARADLDLVLKEALPFGKLMIDQHGEFYPYAVAMRGDGNVRMIAAAVDHDDNPASSEVLRVLGEGLRTQSSELRAVALVTGVRLPSGGGLRFHLEHRDGLEMAFVMPYRPIAPAPGVEYGALEATPTTRHIWA